MSRWQSQQSQIDALKQQLADRDARLATRRSSAQAANARLRLRPRRRRALSSGVQANAEAVTTLNCDGRRPEDDDHRYCADGQRYEEGHHGPDGFADGDPLQGRDDYAGCVLRV